MTIKEARKILSLYFFNSPKSSYNNLRPKEDFYPNGRKRSIRVPYYFTWREYQALERFLREYL